MEQNKALSILVEAVNLAQTRGAFKLEEAKVIAEAIEVFKPKEEPKVETKEEVKEEKKD